MRRVDRANVAARDIPSIVAQIVANEGEVFQIKQGPDKSFLILYFNENLYLLQEDGFFLLKEDEGKIIL